MPAKRGKGGRPLGLKREGGGKVKKRAGPGVTYRTATSLPAGPCHGGTLGRFWREAKGKGPRRDKKGLGGRHKNYLNELDLGGSKRYEKSKMSVGGNGGSHSNCGIRQTWPRAGDGKEFTHNRGTEKEKDREKPAHSSQKYLEILVSTDQRGTQIPFHS